MSYFSKFPNPVNVCVVGASGGIGSAFVDLIAQDPQVSKVFACSRSLAEGADPKIYALSLDFYDERSIAQAAETLKQHGALHVTIIASGLLHDESGDLGPEKSMRDLSMEKMRRVFEVNTFGPALAAKYFLPLMPREERAIFAALSARVGSIGDNRLGGWHAYRASKTALNMMLKNFSIEMARRYKEAIIVGLHPGTVNTALSEPFQGNVPDGKLFTPDYSAQKMLEVLDGLEAENSGQVFAWDGKRIEP